MTVALLDGVTKRYGHTTALDDVSLTFEPGSTVAFLGPNGAGKSTLAALLLGLRRPDCGRVEIGGLDPRNPRARRLLAAVTQESAFPQTLRVREVVEFARRHFAHARPAAEVLGEFDLTQLERRQVGGLSVGQRRRLAVALAFVARPLLLVLDEPTAALDSDGRQTVWRAVHSARKRGASVLVATHQLDEAEAVATHVVAIDHGRIVAAGDVEAVKRKAGGARIRFRANGHPTRANATAVDGWVELTTSDAGLTVRQLVADGELLDGLEVRPLTLEEALAPRLAEP
jgi:ABC-2 type transport system ATP-binding protein